jgi:hypothetical protein
MALSACGSSSSQRTVTIMATTRTVTRSQTSSSADPLAELSAKVRSSVIRIETDGCGGSTIGTGFLIGSRLVATVEHVVDGASSVTLKQGGRVVATGTVIGADQLRDVALVKSSVPITGAVLQLATRAPQLGEGVAAFGFPLGLPLTVTSGSVSGLSRTVPIEGIRRHGMVQTDAAVNPGNSGGPLLSRDDGEVIGLVDIGTNQANGIAFAVSAQVAGPLLQAWSVSPQPIPTVSCGPATPVPSSPQNAAASDPSATLQTYFQDLGSGQYQAAFNLMSSGYQAQNPGWVAARAAAAPGITIIMVGQATVSAGSAEVPVDCYARDSNPTSGSDTNCREFQGTASMIQENGAWRYDPAGNQLSASVVPGTNPNCP